MSENLTEKDSENQNKELKIKSLLNKIDHTLLKQTATPDELKKLCNEAMEYGFYSVCVNPCHIEQCKDYLTQNNVKIATVIGFPLGENTAEVKAFEAKQAVKLGADEIDMVVNVSAIKAKNYAYVKKEIKKVVKASGSAWVKVIIETSLLTEKEIVKVSKICVDSGAKFVKTSTGYFGAGATVENVRLIRKTVGDNCYIKASGGIRDKNTFLSMIDAGADRVGCSASVSIANELFENL